jgi:hypothetical protein
MSSKKIELLNYINSLSDEKVDILYDSLTKNNSVCTILLPMATYLNMCYNDNELERLAELSTYTNR